jgi:5-formyltetrahydrofolate cyclo-ligase
VPRGSPAPAGGSDAPQLPVRRRARRDDATTIVTTVHRLQLLDDELPETAHDFRVDVVVTPDEVVRTGTRRRSPGIIWADLDDEAIAAIPVLAARRP